MKKMRIHHGDGIEAEGRHQSEWCSALNEGVPCGGQSHNDPQVRIFCDEECAEQFQIFLSQTEPEAVAI